MASSYKTPVGSPVSASRSMTPPGGIRRVPRNAGQRQRRRVDPKRMAIFAVSAAGRLPTIESNALAVGCSSQSSAAQPCPSTQAESVLCRFAYSPHPTQRLGKAPAAVQIHGAPFAHQVAVVDMAVGKPGQHHAVADIEDRGTDGKGSLHFGRGSDRNDATVDDAYRFHPGLLAESIVKMFVPRSAYAAGNSREENKAIPPSKRN